MAKNAGLNDFATSAGKRFSQCGYFNIFEMAILFTQPNGSLLHLKFPARGRCWCLIPVEESHRTPLTPHVACCYQEFPGMCVNGFPSSTCFFELHTFQSPLFLEMQCSVPYTSSPYTSSLFPEPSAFHWWLPTGFRSQGSQGMPAKGHTRQRMEGVGGSYMDGWRRRRLGDRWVCG